MSPTPAEITATFDRDGFVIVPNLFRRDESAALKDEMQRVVADVIRESEAEGRDPRIRHSGVFVGLAARSEVYRQAVRDARLLDVIAAIMSPNIAFFSDKAVFKSEGTEFSSPWHQDWAYWKGSHKFSVWVALDDVSPENGCLRVLPGSHRTFVEHNHDTGDGRFGNRLDDDKLDDSGAVTAAMEAGGAVFFSDLTLHASYPNTSRADRWVWIPTYRDAQAKDPAYPFAVAAAVVRGTGSAL